MRTDTAEPAARRRPAARPRKEMALSETLSPRARQVRKWVVAGSVVVSAHIVVLGVVGIAWALPVLVLGYVATGGAALAWLRRREAARAAASQG